MRLINRLNPFIILGLVMMISTHLPAQKVKYKDLYVLLSANDFEQGETFLRRFIANDPEHANANMYMGRLEFLQELCKAGLV